MLSIVLHVIGLAFRMVLGQAEDGFPIVLSIERQPGGPRFAPAPGTRESEIRTLGVILFDAHPGGWCLWAAL